MTISRTLKESGSWQRPTPRGMSIWLSMPVRTSSNEDELAFIMSDHLSHDNVAANPHAAYLFLEQGEQGGQGSGGYNGLRLYLTRTEEETDPQKIEELRRESRKGRDYGDQQKFLVHFKVDGTRRLIGD